jgi:hypothetical protein
MEPRDILLRVRLWGEVQPEWRRQHTREEEIQKRLEERSRKSGLETTPAYRLEKLRGELRRKQGPLALGGALPSAEEARKAGLADTPEYRVERLREELGKKLGEELLAAPPWLKEGEDPIEAFGREFARHFDQEARKAGLADTPKFRLQRLLLEVGLKLLKEGEGDPESLGEEIERRYTKEVLKEAGLADTPAYRVERLVRQVTREVDAELEGNLPSPGPELVRAAWRMSEAVRRIDRFARTVALLNWLADCGKLPALPGEVKPVLMNVPARLSEDNVLPREPPAPPGGTSP